MGVLFWWYIWGIWFGLIVGVAVAVGILYDSRRKMLDATAWLAAAVVGVVLMLPSLYFMLDPAAALFNLNLYADELGQFSGYGIPFSLTESDLSRGVGWALKPYVLDTIQDVAFDFVPPDSAKLSTEVLGQPAVLSGRLELENGVVHVYVERLNGVPLYVVGGIISEGINHGIEDLFDRAAFQLDLFLVKPREIQTRASGGHQ